MRFQHRGARWGRVRNSAANAVSMGHRRFCPAARKPFQEALNFQTCWMKARYMGSPMSMLKGKVKASAMVT